MFTKGKKIIMLSVLGGLAFSGLFSFSNSFKQVDVVEAAIPTNYYKDCEGLSGSSLQSKLLEINKPKSPDYDWPRYEAADEALDDPKSVLCLYTRHNIPKSNHVGSGYAWDKWNREHIWTQGAYPKSASDNHNIFACEGQINNYRGNMPFGEVEHIPANQKDIFGHKTDCYWTDNYFEPCDAAKGEVARAVMYGTVMYTYTMTQEIKSIDLALKWHLEHPITERDTRRNDVVYGLQGNRNPFVDHKSYACKIWGNSSSNAKKICDQYNGWTDEDEPIPTKTLTDISITGTANKLVYNAGESFETAGLTVTATYTSSTGTSKENVTSKVSVSPNPLTKGTTSVTLSYMYAGVTKTAIYSGITVKEAPNPYGTLENPLSVSEAKALVGKECTSSKTYTKQQIYCRGIVSSFISESGINRRLVRVRDINSASSTMNVDSLTMTTEQYNNLEEGDQIIFHGYGYNNGGTHQFKDNGSAQVTFDRNESKQHDVPVNSVVINNTTFNFEVESTCQLDVTVLPSDATNKTLSYTSSDTSVATVDNAGVITFIKAGEVNITVSSVNNKTAVAKFTVTNKPQPITKTPVEVAITKNPTKTTYNLNENYDTSGLVIEAHFIDGTSEDITNLCTFKEPDMSTAGTKVISYKYDKNFSVNVMIEVLNDEVSALNIPKNPYKLNYFESEEFSPIGIKVEATIGSEVKDVTSMVEYQYNFAKSNLVKVKFGGVEKRLRVTIESGEITAEHKAADYTYVFRDKVDVSKKEEVTLSTWKILEFNYNALDDSAKAVLKNIVTNYGGGEVSAEDGITEKLKDCISGYDEIYLLHKDDGFTDFMNRKPVAPTPTPDPTPTNDGLNMVILISVAAGIIMVIIVIIAIVVPVSKKKKKQAKK